MLKFIIFLITIIAVALCINININEPNVTPNVIETQQNNIVLDNNNVSNENNIAENVVNNQNEPSNKNTDKSNGNSTSKPENNNTSSTKDNSSSDSQTKGTFNSKEIPDNIYQKMLGKSIPTEYKDKVDLKTLRYLQISYFGFDGQAHVGEMIVNAKLANDVLEIFKELYNIKYPIEKIKLIDEYNADDNLSMSDNNTSCFCYRVVPGSTKLSNHAKGCAIDINPLYNPYVTKASTTPVNGAKYADRTLENKYKIDKNSDIYKIFIKHRLVLGWKLVFFKRLSAF